ncbi:MAG: chorismate mutase [Labedaea sp.]
MSSVRAIRGAIQIEADTAGAIIAGTSRLISAVLSSNELGPDDVVSMLFTLTSDLTAAFPAAAARELGLTDVALMCATEVAVPGSLPRVVRLLAHVDTSLPRAEIRHVYLAGAEVLRPDLAHPSLAPR